MSNVKKGDILNTRKVLADTLCDLAGKDERIWAVTSDCGGEMKDFVNKYPDRFVDTGIAEQNAAGISAGIALSGGIPFIMGMTPFLTMRAFEQNRTAIGYQNLPVRIVGWVGGITSGGGSTHYAMEDLSIMSSIANMKVVSVSDPLYCESVIRESLNVEGPMFIRLTMAKADPVIYEPGSAKYVPGKSIQVRGGSDITIITHGGMVTKSSALSDKLKDEGISVRVIDMCSVKPFDEEAIIAAAKETGGIIVWEDHFAHCGMGNRISGFLMEKGIIPKSFKIIGIPEVYPGFGPSDGLYEMYKMDAGTVEANIHTMTGK